MQKKIKSSPGTNDKQHIFYDTSDDVLGRTQLQANEEFNEDVARNVLDSHYTHQRICHCRAYCLEDRLRFKRTNRLQPSPPRKFHLYNEIRYFYIFSNHPDTVVFCVQDLTSRRDHYEVHRFHGERDANNVCDLVNQARRHPQCRLVLNDVSPDEGIRRQLSSVTNISTGTQEWAGRERPAFIEEVLVTEPVENVPSVRLHQQSRNVVLDNASAFEMSITPQMKHQNLANKPVYYHTLKSGPVREVPVTEQAYFTVRSSSNGFLPRAHSEAEINKMLSSRPVEAKTPTQGRYLASNHMHQSELDTDNPDTWFVDLKYLDSDPTNGTRLTDHGPIYMFTAHSLVPMTRIYSECYCDEEDDRDTDYDTIHSRKAGIHSGVGRLGGAKRGKQQKIRAGNPRGHIVYSNPYDINDPKMASWREPTGSREIQL
ncbi:unnamed protein product [Protopolystoma xenopodis]|uniref:Trematode PH-like domain-containing protein n=1 Tax=Protopolystoma xenopodis TaxID=117903 RepID=A0A3S5A089_9PLAT|nr:unnamed protein product [Protopolystoma xenopodis]